MHYILILAYVAAVSENAAVPISVQVSSGYRILSTADGGV